MKRFCYQLATTKIQAENKRLEGKVLDMKRLLVVSDDRSGRNLIRAEKAEAKVKELEEEIIDRVDTELSLTKELVKVDDNLKVAIAALESIASWVFGCAGYDTAEKAASGMNAHAEQTLLLIKEK